MHQPDSCTERLEGSRAACMASPAWLPDVLRCMTRERSVEKRYLALRTAVMVGLKRLPLLTQSRPCEWRLL